MKARLADIKDILVEILMAKGLTQAESEAIAEDYLDAELSGKPSHGLSAFGVVVKDAETRGHHQVLVENGPVAFIDGKGDIGHLVVRSALEWAREPISKFGMAFIGIGNIKRFATPGTVARLATSSGLLSIVLEYGGQPFMVPPGGREPVLSTNPIGIGIPNAGAPFVLDMACSQRAFYYIALAKKLGKEIPEGWAVDSAGQPTTDPEKAVAVLPFGGYKGYGLAMAIEILTGPLVGVAVGKSGRLDRRGALIILCSPSVFGVKAEDFRNAVDTLLQEVRSAAVREGVEPTHIPGERGQDLKEQASQSGTIEIDDAIWNDLLTLRSNR